MQNIDTTLRIILGLHYAVFGLNKFFIVLTRGSLKSFCSRGYRFILSNWLLDAAGGVLSNYLRSDADPQSIHQSGNTDSIACEH